MLVPVSTIDLNDDSKQIKSNKHNLENNKTGKYIEIIKKKR